MPPQSMTGVHLKPPKCLKCKVGTCLDENMTIIRECNVGFVELGLGKHGTSLWVGSLHVFIGIQDAKVYKGSNFVYVECRC